MNEIYQKTRGNRMEKYLSTQRQTLCRHQRLSTKETMVLHNIHYNLSRAVITVINRIRAGHCSVPVHLHRIKIIQGSSGSCGDESNIEHKLFAWKRHSPHTQQVYQQISITKKAPIRSIDAVANPEEQTYTVRAFSQFVHNTKVKL